MLILEDEAIIAMDVESILTDAGLDIAANLSNCSSALDWLEGNRADVAILDISLADGSCQHVAKRLAEIGIPFVVFSGSTRTETHDPIFLTGGWLQKPAPASTIVEAVLSVLPATAQ